MNYALMNSMIFCIGNILYLPNTMQKNIKLFHNLLNI